MLLRQAAHHGLDPSGRLANPPLMMAEAPTPMSIALEEAAAAARRGEVPVGAVIFDDTTQKILAQAGNRIVELADPTAHAEMNCIRQAAREFGSERLTGCDLYVTLEPCPMCAQAISFARIRRLYFGAEDEKGGGVVNGPRIFDQPTCHHKPEIYGGLSEKIAAKQLRDFFQERR